MEVALVGIAGVAIGALLQIIGARQIESFRQRKSNQRDAYNALLSALSLIAHSREPDLEGARRELAHAKSLVALYGSPRALEKLANLFEGHETLKGILAQASLSEALLIMRRDVGSGHEEGIQGNMFGLLFR